MLGSLVDLIDIRSNILSSDFALFASFGHSRGCRLKLEDGVRGLHRTRSSHVLHVFDLVWIFTI